MMTGTCINLISVNVRGLRERNKRKTIFEWVKKKGGEIVLLQETYSTPDIEDVWRRDWSGQMFFSHYTNHSRGVLILVAPQVDFKIEAIKSHVDGRYIFLKGVIQGLNLLLGNIYFPTRDKVKEQMAFLDLIDQCISEVCSINDLLVLGGDFNVIVDENLDYSGITKPIKTTFVKYLDVFLRKHQLVDIWRKRNPNRRQFTFRQRTPLVQSRLDYWFTSKKLENVVKNCDIISSITPDHSGISLQLKCLEDVHDHGKSYWKFNNSLCSDKGFVEGMIKEIKKVKEEQKNDFESKLVFWDFLKMKMRQYAIKYSKEKVKERKNEIDRLENEIHLLEAQTSRINDNVEEISRKKGQLKQLYNISLEGIKIRSRAAWYEEGEENKEYFKQLSESNKKKTFIRELCNEKGEVTKDKKEILHIIRRFYEKLYSCRITLENIEESGFFADIPKLSEESRNLCEGEITHEECFNVLKNMKLNKSPGNDGFSVEFYLTFWPYIGGLIVDAFNESFVSGNLSVSQKQGVITLIEKDGKDPLQIKNYRPITLLNVDYKILSKVLATRMKEVLLEIIGSDQVGYIKNRNIGEAIRLIDDMIFHCLNNEIESFFLIAVDFEKAFDSVSHEFLLKALKLFGFGPSFCSWVETLYNGICSCVMNGGTSTGYFDISRGVRQGDPLSPYLFVVVIEILAHAVRQDGIFKGINFEDFEVRQVLYADDMTIFAKNKSSIKRLWEILRIYYDMTGLKVNMDKTNIMFVGNDGSIVESLSFGKVVREVKILGVYFSVDLKLREEMNFKEILSKIKRLLGWWKQRDLSLLGKIHLLKTYALSKLSYVSSSIVVPLWVFTEVKQICFNFIWKGKDRIKRAIMYQDYGEGGFRMMNFEIYVKSQRVMWVKRLLYGEKNMGWKKLFHYMFRSVGGNLIFHCNYETSILSLKMPTFYREILKAWQDLEGLRLVDSDKMNQIFFNNKYFLLKGRMIFNDKLYRQNVYQLHSLFDEKGIRPIAHFQSLGLNSQEIVYVWRICDVILKSGRYNWSVVSNNPIQVNEDIRLKMIHGNLVRLCDIPSRKIYEYFVSNLQKSYNLELRDGHHKFQFSKEVIREIFQRPRSTTVLAKLREFQFKLLHGVIYTKEHLFKFGFVMDNLCSFCKQSIETYSHLFWECQSVQDLWRGIIQEANITELNNARWEDIHIGIPGNSLKIKGCNTIIFMTKFILYSARVEGNVPSLHTIQEKLKECREEENRIAVKRGKIGIHLLKWESLT